jgi:hypothetical protein
MPDIGSVDTSSYPKATMQVSPLDLAQKLGNIQQQSLNISQSKLDLMNHQFSLMNAELSSMSDDPKITKEQAAARLNKFADTFSLPDPVRQHMMGELAAAPSVKSFSDNALRRGMDVQQKINRQYGSNSTQQDNTNIYQGVTASPAAGGGFTPSTQMPIQPPPTQPNVNNQPTLPNGQPNPAYMQPGIVGAAGPPGVVPAAPVAAPRMPVQQPTLPVQRPPAAVPGPITNPAIRGPSTNFSPPGMPPGSTTRVTGATVQPPPSIVTGPPANFEVGQKLYAQDQASSTAKATSLKPLEEAYDLAKNVATGSGTESLNKARAYLANIGLIKADEKNPTVIYQMLNKNLAQFIDKTGSRSDADLAVKESGNANAKTQLQPALLHMVQKIIGRERIEIARPQAFEGADYQNYGKHSALFPTSQDERAYSIDKMEPQAAKALYADMRNKALNGKTPAEQAEGAKFLRSLSVAKKTGQVSGLGQ